MLKAARLKLLLASVFCNIDFRILSSRHLANTRVWWQPDVRNTTYTLICSVSHVVHRLGIVHGAQECMVQGCPVHVHGDILAALEVVHVHQHTLVPKIHSQPLSLSCELQMLT